jgi:hypothetical protein
MSFLMLGKSPSLFPHFYNFKIQKPFNGLKWMFSSVIFKNEPRGIFLPPTLAREEKGK